MTQETAYFAMGGGLDLVTPPISRSPGAAIGGYNYEPRPEGYRRVAGYERYDGRPLASAASYWTLAFTAGTAALATGDTVTAPDAAAVVLAVLVEDGSWGAGTAAGRLVLTAVTGTVAAGQALSVGGTVRAHAAGGAVERGAGNDSDDRAWLAAAVEGARSTIGPVPGAGPVRGVAVLRGTVYAVRDDAGGTQGVLHRATATGWQPCALGWTLAFGIGSAAFEEGQTVTGATSGATGTITRVVVERGDWTTGDAAGQLVLSATSGAFADGEVIASATGSAQADGTAAANRLEPGGRYEFAVYGFGGAADGARLYGCNGVNRAFEWDGVVFVPIRTGLDPDRPAHIAAHNNRLFVAMAGSLLASALGNPLSWQVIEDAGEIAFGDEITALLSGYAGVLAVFGRSRTGILYGTVFTGEAADAEFKVISEEAGALPGSVQHLSQPVCLDDRGVRGLAAVQEYGDFAAGTLSRLIKPWLDARRGAAVACSLRVREADQYRLFWDDGSGLVMDIGGGRPAFMPLALGRALRCAVSGDGPDGREWLLAGDDAGVVHRLDSGVSFDGARVPALLRLAFNHLKSPTQVKRFHKATLEVRTQPQATLLFTADCSYGDPDLPSAAEQGFQVAGSGGFWNEGEWDLFYWSSSVEGLAQAHMDGSGTNVSFAIASEADDEAPHTLHGMTLHFSRRGMVR